MLAWIISVSRTKPGQVDVCPSILASSGRLFDFSFKFPLESFHNGQRCDCSMVRQTKEWYSDEWHSHHLASQETFSFQPTIFRATKCLTMKISLKSCDSSRGSATSIVSINCHLTLREFRDFQNKKNEMRSHSMLLCRWPSYSSDNQISWNSIKRRNIRRKKYLRDHPSLDLMTVILKQFKQVWTQKPFLW